ncbi:cholinephosphotransferase 1 isoform X1 [Drosophila nasuta]|uniref:diacylglycerol cholinephosphotransferase n=2 Tax=Drosophila albomicans TaxID=7291 RepID=A0A6P8WYG7_DROAB|nr:cholinephosphotransferase 1 isoform X1 [Drosophila albomicans]XP_034104484.1 cholinephosphotransferase 1 isoform X1 [Drosophila albomicans]XP_060655556.1 cholinephosphotransferase 1 isoform X1 [Drosophila nasuta]XP_060655559.1 cholinephosphotransferase 1 isoform X1 [Drosophila nasuta]
MPIYLAYKQSHILSPQQLRKLSEHKYSCFSASLLDPLLQPWWNWLVAQTPLWLAPNLITIVGLILNIVTTLILICYSPNGVEPPPRWTCFLCALGLFIYQSLDSIDGKQARRTNTSSPLGELFDHGCDSISTIFVALSACISCQLGHYPNWLFFQCFCAIALFYCAHWQTYVSGTMRFGRIDVTEAQFSIIAIHLVSAALGPEIWLTKVGIGNIELWAGPAVTTIVCGVLSLTYVFSVVVAGGVGKNGSTVAGTSVLSPSIPLTLVVLPALIIAQKSPENIFTEHASVYILAFGMVAAKITNKLVIAHMTKAEMEYLDWSLLGPALLFLNQYFNCIIPEIWLLWFALIWGTQDLLRYCSQVCLEICQHLRIDLFRIPYSPKSSSTASSGTATTTTSVGSQSNFGADKNGGASHRKSKSKAH